MRVQDTSKEGASSQWDLRLAVKKDGQDLHLTCMDLPEDGYYFSSIDFYDK